MSYISFYRKWRPQTFSEVIGQEHIVKTLQNAISKNRLVHGYMFCGPKGTGKTSIARIFSKAINCVHGPAIEPCNKCDNCISITAGTNVDIVEIDGASNRGIENIRELREKIKFLPIFLRKKIYIIDEAHQITPDAFNALLKTLEEPPEHVIFILATTAPQKVIQTIMSRCQRFDFEPISLGGLRQRLKDIAASENIDITDSALSIVAKYSDGSLRDAEGILEQLSSFGDSRVTVDEVSSILGIIDQDMLFELANIILEKNISQSLLFISRLFSTSFSLKAFISEFLEHLYSLYVIKNYKDPVDILDMPDDFKESYYNQAGLFSSGQLEYLIDLFSDLLAQIKDSENSKTFFKAAVIKALNTEAIKDGQVIKKLKKMDFDIQQFKNDLTELKTGSKSDGRVSAVNIEAGDAGRVAAGKIERVFTNEFERPGAINIIKAERDKAESVFTGKTGKSDATKIIKPAEADISGKTKAAAPGNRPEKIEPEELKEDHSFADKKNSTEQSDVLENSGIDLPEDLPPGLKKSPGESSQLILEMWETVLIKIKEKSVPLQAVLKEVKRFRLQGNKIYFFLESKNNWHKDHLNKLENRALIQELLKSLTGKNFEIIFDFVSDDNISESTDLVHQARKKPALNDLPLENGDIGGSAAVLTDMSIPEVDVGKNIIGNKEEDVNDYFEKIFKVKEK